MPTCFALLCIALTFTCAALATRGRGFLGLGSGSVWPSHDPPLWTTRSGRGCSFFLLASTFYITPFDNCFMDPQLPYTTAVLVTAFLTNPPSEQALSPDKRWKPVRSGQSQRNGICLRRKALLDIHPKLGARDVQPHKLKARHSKLLCQQTPTRVEIPMVGCLTVVSRLFVIPMSLHQ